jgi:putative transposase
MPSTKEKEDQSRELFADRYGAGGEPPGEPTAPPSRARRRSGVSQARVDDAVDRATLRRMVAHPDGERIPDEVIDALLAGASTEQEIAGPGGLLAQLTKRLVERAMEVELTDHLGYEPHAEPPGGTGNTRNGTSPKTLVTEHGQVAIDAPRDRDGSFAPKIVRKRQRRFEGFDDKILALYSRGLSTRDIEAHLAEIYGVKVGRDLISKVTDGVMDDARAWAARPLEDVYPVISSTRWCSRSARAGRCSAAPATWRWGSPWRATATCWACGFRKPRAPNSGCRCCQSSSSAASQTS